MKLKRSAIKSGSLSALAGICILIFIWGNSIMSAESSSGESGKLLSWLRSIPFLSDALTEHMLRKAAHFTEFFCLGAVCSYWPARRHKSFYAHMLMGLLVALLDETIQLFSAGRSAQVSDIWIDYGGFCIGKLLIYIIFKAKHGNSHKSEKRED